MTTSIARFIAGACALLASIAFAQQSPFPSRPVALIVPVAPGGILDTVARMIAPEMSKQLGQPVIVDN
ncbi:MAG TPA: hypothetical protein VLH12_13435, partial [Usitatibacter sp.]|nr:hypothetical protein [Usitatibacter sp.]